jgi:hypothetical protein
MLRGSALSNDTLVHLGALAAIYFVVSWVLLALRLRRG